MQKSQFLTGRSRAGAVLLAGCLLVASTLGQLLGWGTGPAFAADGLRSPPVPGAVLRGFQIGEHDWEPGHRGVDLAAAVGAAVASPADGTVSWVGVIAGVSMMTVQHPDGLRSTFQPVSAILPVGSPVRTGQQIAVLNPGHCASPACLHWGVRAGENYLDPLAWLAEGRVDAEVRLLPRSAVPRQLPPPGVGEQVEGGILPTGELPTAGMLTSAWGDRVNPISGQSEFHDGVDIGAPCGQPVQTLRPGVVVAAGPAGGYGLRVEVDHGGGQGSSYSHLSGLAVLTGQQLAAGEIVGQVGSTGYSTGCHLHYSLTSNGQSIDPLGGG